MTNRDWIELFFSESYEKQINDMILEDIDFIIPYDRLRDYVHTIVNIPFVEYIDYIRNERDIRPLTESDFPSKNVFLSTDHFVDYFKTENNEGINSEDLLQASWYSFGNNKANATYALRSLSLLGLVYQYYDLWYLSCIGYVLNTLPYSDRSMLYARLLLRKPLFMNAVKSHHFNLYDEISQIGMRNLHIAFAASSLLFNFIKTEYYSNNLVCTINTSKPREKQRTPREKIFRKQFVEYEKNRFVSDILYTIGNAPYISKNDLDDLREKIQSEDLASIHLLMNVCQRYILIKSIDYIGKGVSLDDLIIEAELGLYKQIMNYRHSTIKFFNLITLGINQSLREAILYDPISFHVSFPVNHECKRINKYVSDFVQKNHFTPTYKTIINELDYYLQDTNRYSDYYDFAFLEDNYSDGTFATNARLIEQSVDADCFFAEDTYEADYELNKLEKQQFVRSMLAHLSNGDGEIKRNIEIVCMFFGIGCKYPYTLETIADKYGLTRERARQIVVKMIDDLKSYFDTNHNLDNIIQRDWMNQESEYVFCEGQISKIDKSNTNKKSETQYSSKAIIIDDEYKHFLYQKQKSSEEKTENMFVAKKIVKANKYKAHQKKEKYDKNDNKTNQRIDIKNETTKPLSYAQSSDSVKAENVFLGLKKMRLYSERIIIYSAIYHQKELTLDKIIKITGINKKTVSNVLNHACSVRHVKKRAGKFSLIISKIHIGKNIIF